MRLFLPLIFLTSWFVGCASAKKTDCSHLDWYELGRQQGISGQNLSTQAPDLQVCRANQPNALLLLKNGYETGLESYCTPQNFYQLGYQQLSLPKNCPKTHSLALTEQYTNGRKVLELEQKLLEVEAQTQLIRANSVREPASTQAKSNQKIRQLENEIRFLNAQINTLKSRSGMKR